MAALRNGSKYSHTSCMLRFCSVSRLALNPNLIFEIGSNKTLRLSNYFNISESGCFFFHFLHRVSSEEILGSHLLKYCP